MNIDPKMLIEVSDLHDREIDDVIDDSLKLAKAQLKMECELIIKSRKYPIEYDLKGIGVVTIDSDKKKSLKTQDNEISWESIDPEKQWVRSI